MEVTIGSLSLLLLVIFVISFLYLISQYVSGKISPSDMLAIGTLEGVGETFPFIELAEYGVPIIVVIGIIVWRLGWI